MGSTLRLEVFETADLSEQPTLLMPEDIEELRLTAYERGYVAGYEDAEAQSRTTAAGERSRIMGALEGLNFGYHEARADVLKALEPLIRAMIVQLLPATARVSIVPMVIETLLPLAERRAALPLILRVPAGDRAAFEAAFEGMVLPPLELREDPSLARGQAEISGEYGDCAVDLASLIAQVEQAMDAQYHTTDQEARHG